MSKTEDVYDLIDKIEIPEDQDVVVLKYKVGKNKGEYVCRYFDGKSHKYEGGKYVACLDHKQTLLLGQLISKEVFPNRDYRYTLLSLQESYDLTHQKWYVHLPKECKEFKKLTYDMYLLYWFHNREVIINSPGNIIFDSSVFEEDGKPKEGITVEGDYVYKYDKLIGFTSQFKKMIKGKIFSDPIVFEKDDELVYGGKSIETGINTYDIFDTLYRVGLFRSFKSKPKYACVCKIKNYACVEFDKYKECSVSSGWGCSRGSKYCFGHAYEQRGYDDSECLVVLGKTNCVNGVLGGEMDE